MPKLVAAVLLTLVLFGSERASAEYCGSVCNYWHDYGPYDLSWVRPGLAGYPRCDRYGNCGPYLAYTAPPRRYGRITIRPLGPRARRY